jgi:hypothetical protein
MSRKQILSSALGLASSTHRRIFLLVLTFFMLGAVPRLTAQATGGTVLFADDAERAIMEAWVWSGWGANVGSTGTPSQAQVHSGLWSYAFQAGQNAFWTVPYSARDPQYLKFWFYVPSSYSLTSGSTTNLAGLESTTTYSAFPIGMTNSGETLYTSLKGATGTHGISTNTWHTIELKYNVGGGTITLWLDGTSDIALTGQTLATENTVYIGVTSGTGTIYFDDFTVASAASGNPASGITVRHAYPGNRLAMKIQTYLWGAGSSDQLVSSIDGTTFSTISSPGTYQEPILVLTTLSAGNHILQVQLQDSGGMPRQTWTETIVACGCTPTNGIDAYNNIVRDGKKILPITGWMMNPDNANLWLGTGTPSGSNMNGPGINASGWASGWASNYSVSQYQQFMEGNSASAFPLSALNCLNGNDLPVIGPSVGRMGGFGTSGTAAGDAANMAGYASALSNEPCILAWFGYDEASVNGWTQLQMAGTMNAAHANDSNHAFLYDDATTPYLNLSWYYPNSVADIYSSDNYPLCYSNSLHGNGARQMSDWVHMMDREAYANYGLVPNYQVLELAIFANGAYSNFNCSTSNEAGTSISNTTVYNEFWMSFIHGRKGFAWYTDTGLQYDSGYSPGCTAQATPPAKECFPVSSSGVPAITPVMSAVTAITPAVMLAAPTGRTVTSNQTTNCAASPYTAGARVDATVREDSSNVWVLAARLTDPLCNSNENTASTLSTQLTVSSLTNGTATVYGENRTVPVSGGVITDNFNPWAVHIYQIPTSGGPPLSPPVLNPAVVH